MKYNIYTYDKKRFKHNHNFKHVFFIQNKGEHAGRILFEPIANCWVFETNEYLYLVALTVLFESKLLLPLIIGAVVPFIPLYSYKFFISNFFRKILDFEDDFLKKYSVCCSIDEHLSILETKIDKYKKYKTLLCRQFVCSVKDVTIY